MSRHSRITESLTLLKKMQAIDEFHAGNDVDLPNRKRWLVQVTPIVLASYTTGEVEAFIAGADAVVATKKAPVR
mgnify:CR=1 FL=1